MERGSLVVRSLWAAGLLVAAANHARILVEHGLFWDYRGVGWASAAYWSSLTILDPLVAVLLFARPRPGIGCTILLVATNLAHNLAVTARYSPDGEFWARTASDPFLAAQAGFLLFVAATARLAWKGAPASGSPARER
jgi:hypothetical protein